MSTPTHARNLIVSLRKRIINLLLTAWHHFKVNCCNSSYSATWLGVRDTASRAFCTALLEAKSLVTADALTAIRAGIAEIHRREAAYSRPPRTVDFVLKLTERGAADDIASWRDSSEQFADAYGHATDVISPMKKRLADLTEQLAMVSERQSRYQQRIGALEMVARNACRIQAVAGQGVSAPQAVP